MAKAITKSRARNPGNPGNPRRRNRRRSFTIPLAIVLPVVHGISEAVWLNKHRGRELMFNELMLRYLGIDVRPGQRGLTTEYLRHGLYQLIAGALVHQGANMLGVNRALARARIPWIRI